MTDRELLKQLAPGQSIVVPAPEGCRHHALKRLSQTARSLWGNGVARIAVVHGGIYVLRKAPIPQVSE
jgi:hypothetical protein